MPWTSKRRLEPPPMAATLSFLDLVRGLLGAVLHVLRGIADLVAGSLFTAVLDGADSLIDRLAGTFHGPLFLAGREQQRRGAQGGRNDDFVHECSKSNCEVCGTGIPTRASAERSVPNRRRLGGGDPLRLPKLEGSLGMNCGATMRKRWRCCRTNL